MGLDGISVNQLRITPENTSRENAISADLQAKRNVGDRSVNSLDKKSAIDTDDKENTSFFGGASSSDEEENSEDEAETVEYEKIDLSNRELYEIKPDEDTNSLVIYNKQEGKIVQQITPGKLSTLVDNLKNPSGVLVNKRI